MYDTTRKVWTIEDLDEFAHVTTYSAQDLSKYLSKNKDKFQDGIYIVCEYSSIKSLVPDSVTTIKSFIFKHKVKSRWVRSKNMIQSLIGV